MAHLKEKKNQQKLPLRKNQMVDLGVKEFNTTALKMLKDLKESVEKVNKIMYEQIRKSIKKIENIKKKQFWSWKVK